MPHFVDWEQELAELNALLARPAAQFVLVFGRRRIGKTTLLTTWAVQTGLPTLDAAITWPTPICVSTISSPVKDSRKLPAEKRANWVPCY